MVKIQIGEKAPAFTFKDHEGIERTLESFKGKKVVLYFYPKDNTPGCTAEACNLRDNYYELTKNGFEVIGVSADTPKSHDGFRAKHELPFYLIADQDKEIIKAYGTWGEKKMMGRAYMGILRHTFVIDEEGKIEAVIEKVDTRNHADQILKELKK